MMRLLVIVILSMFLVACGQTEAKESSTEDKTDKVSTTSLSHEESETNNVEENEESEEPEEVVEIPTERTVDTKTNSPWWYFSTGTLADLQSQGETVYLFSDAEELEAHVRKVAAGEDSDFNGDATKEKVSESTGKYLELFIKEVGVLFEGHEYFATLSEAHQALVSGDYENAVSLIDEATSIRQSMEQ